MIKNTTPYIGKLRLKFEKHPHYSGKDKLNKVHLNLGFTKLVSRITPEQDRDGWKIKPACIKLIEENTGLKIKTAVFGPNNEHELPNSCHTPDGVYVGSIEDGWWYYQNRLRSTKGSHPHAAWSKSTKQWIGYSHRASCAFGKGDKLFDAEWIPTDNDLLTHERYFVNRLHEWDAEIDEWEKSASAHKVAEDQMTLNHWAVGHIPFRLRGSKTIHSYEEAYEAAVNFSKYVA